MLTKEAIEAIQTTAVKASGVGAEIMTAPGEPAGVYYVRGKDGVMERQFALTVTNHRTEDIDSLIRLACDSIGKRTIFYTPGTSREKSPGATIVAMNEDAPRWRTTFHCNHSLPFMQLQDWSIREPRGVLLKQVELYGLLRTTFYGTLPSGFNLIDAIKKVDFKKVQEATGTVDRKGVSMSKALVHEASGATGLPETFAFTVPVYDGPIELKIPITCGIELDAPLEGFRLAVLPGEIDAAMETAAMWIAKLINNKITDEKLGDICVYRGTPTK